jgi:hypothetical protein
MIRRTMILATALFVGATAGVVHGGSNTVIESDITGVVTAFTTPSAQNLRLDTTGTITSITVWSQGSASSPGEIVIHRGTRPGDVVRRQALTWESSPTRIELSPPLPVAEGETYTITASGQSVELILGETDPYTGGEAVFFMFGGWLSLDEACASFGFCLPYVIDQRISIEIETDSDEDSDGVDDDMDRCAGTVLPDESVKFLRPNRYGATEAGFASEDGVVVATLAGTGGCSATQIVAELDLGRGHERFGITRPHLERWIADVSG